MIAKLHALFTKTILYSLRSKVLSKIKLWFEFKPPTIRTTNAYEFFHSRFNPMFYSAHLNYIHLKNIQIDVYVKIRIQERKIFMKNIINEKKYCYNNMCYKFVKSVSRKF